MGRRQIKRSNTQDLKDMLLAPNGGRFISPYNSCDEVFPGIVLGDIDTALSTHLLKDMKVTHVLNAAYGRNEFYYQGFVNTGVTYYQKAGIKFLGIPAMDMPSFYLKPYFDKAANFIEEALSTKGGKVLVHCRCGISRSAAIVAAFLMLRRGMTVQAALATIREKRSICPNNGFLSQLADLDYDLRCDGKVTDNPIGSDEEYPPTEGGNPGSSAFYPRIVSRTFLGVGHMPTYTPYGEYKYRREQMQRARSEERTLPPNYVEKEKEAARNPSYRSYRSRSVGPTLDYEPLQDKEEDYTPSFKPYSVSFHSRTPATISYEFSVPSVVTYKPPPSVYLEPRSPSSRFVTRRVTTPTSTYVSHPSLQATIPSTTRNIRDPLYPRPRSLMTYVTSLTNPLPVPESSRPARTYDIFIPKKYSYESSHYSTAKYPVFGTYMPYTRLRA